MVELFEQQTRYMDIHSSKGNQLKWKIMDSRRRCDR